MVASRDALVEQLQTLGFSQYESDVYVTLLSRPTFTASQVAAQSGVPRQRVYDVLERLLAQGLATELLDSDVRTFAAVDPTTALQAWLDHQHREMEEAYSQRSAHVHELLPHLSSVYAAGHEREQPDALLERINDTLLFTERVRDAIREAGETVDCMLRTPFTVSLEDQLREIEIARARNLRLRALYEQEVTNDKGILAYLQLFEENGAGIRLSNAIPVTVYVIDGTYAWLALPQPALSEESAHTLAVAHSGLGTTLQAAFEYYWRNATPFS